MDLVIEDGSRVGTDLLPDERGQCQARDRAALDELRLRRRRRQRRRACSSSRAAIRAPTAISRGCSAITSATRKMTPLAGRDPAADLATGDQSRHPPARLRSSPAIMRTSSSSIPATIADHATYEKPQQLRDRRRRCFRQRRPGAAGRRAHRRQARAASCAGRAGPAGLAEARARNSLKSAMGGMRIWPLRVALVIPGRSQ